MPELELVLRRRQRAGQCIAGEHGVGFAGLFFGSTETRDLSDYLNGVLTFDIKVVSAGINTAGFVMKADRIYPVFR